VDSAEWTIRFKGYLPIDDRMQERLQRVMEQIDRVPDSAMEVDADGHIITIDWTQVRGWADDYRSVVRTLRVGGSIVVVPPWETHVEEPGDVVVTIDPGPVLGSGLHETTTLCLEALEERVRPGCSVIDFGAGSGMLAIAAARLGASSVVAIEADPEAAQVARENVARNGLGEAVIVLEGDSPSLVVSKVDVIAANIVPAVIVPNLAALAGSLAREGVLIASGVSIRNRGEIEDRLAEVGLELVRRRIRNRWVAIEARFRE